MPQPAGRRSGPALRRYRGRTLWLRLHLWLGAGLGLFFALLGLTGSLLVFDDEIDARLNPQLLLSEQEGERIAPDAALNAIAADADPAFRTAWLSAPRLERGTWQAFGGPDDDPFGHMVAVDPVSGEVLGSRSLRSGFVAFVYSLHTRLLLGLDGRNVVGALGIAFTLSLITGAILWLSRRNRPRGGAQVIIPARSGQRMASTHRLLGITLLVPLLVVAGTGIGLRLPALVNPVIEVFSDLEDHASGARAAQDIAGARLPVDQALARAREHFPDAPLTGIGIPRNEGDVYQFAFREADHPRRDIGRSYVWMDPLTGEILATRRWVELKAGDRLRDWLNPVHGGTAFGLPGRLFVALLGLVPVILFITGLSIRLVRRGRSHSSPRIWSNCSPGR